MFSKLLYLLLLSGILIPVNSVAQTFGFGCLGFVGGYGGFTYQQFDAKGLNDYIIAFNDNPSVTSPMDEFSYATGYRVGLNFFRASFPAGFIITAKGYYQFLAKKNSAITEDQTVGIVNTSVDLDLKNWAVGLDVGLNITNNVSWKIVDGALHFNNVKLTETNDYPGETEVKKYKSDAGVLGYSIGTGVIIAIVKDYISVEGLAGYTFMSFDDIKTDDGEYYLYPGGFSSIYQYPKFIESGGFTAVVQLNVGFPLL